jgi:hypothetical protein
MRGIAALVASIVAACGPVFGQLPAPAPCTSGTLDQYFELGSVGCTIGQAVFSEFVLLPIGDGAEFIQPSNVRVVPINDAARPGLEFVVNLSAQSGQVLQVRLNFTVSGRRFVKNTLSTSGASATGDAAVAVIENKCLGGLFFFDVDGCFDAVSFDFATRSSAVAVTISSQSVAADPLEFAPVEQIGVIKDIVIDGGTSGKAALVSTRTLFE